MSEVMVSASRLGSARTGDGDRPCRCRAFDLGPGKAYWLALLVSLAVRDARRGLSRSGLNQCRAGSGELRIWLGGRESASPARSSAQRIGCFAPHCFAQPTLGLLDSLLERKPFGLVQLFLANLRLAKIFERAAHILGNSGNRARCAASTLLHVRLPCRRWGRPWNSPRALGLSWSLAQAWTRTPTPTQPHCPAGCLPKAETAVPRPLRPEEWPQGSSWSMPKMCDASHASLLS